MLRTQVYLTEEQGRNLKALAAQTGQSQSELIRQAVDQLVERQEEKEKKWKAAWEQACGMWADRPEVEEEIMEARRSWNRRLERLFGEDDGHAS